MGKSGAGEGQHRHKKSKKYYGIGINKFTENSHICVNILTPKEDISIITHLPILNSTLLI